MERIDQLLAQTEITLNDETGEVSLSFNEGEKALSCNSALLSELLEKAGYQTYQVDPKCLEETAQKINQNKAFSNKIAQRVDGRIEITIADDKLSATMQISEPCGGKAADFDMVKTAIEEHEIVTDMEHLATCWQQAIGESMVIAKGKAPRDGKNAILTQLFIENKFQPKVREDGSADMFDLQSFSIVNPGDVLLKRQPATPGIPGQDIHGKEIAPTPGTDPGINATQQGVDLNPENENELVATLKGHPLQTSAGIKVDPVLSFSDIDFSTGNIDFDGSISIKGDITDGFIVEATGDIEVKGNIYRAEVTAGNDITVNGGIVGRHADDADLSIVSINDYDTKIMAGNNVSAKFINFSYIKSQADVQVKEYIYHSFTIAGNSVTIGDNNKGTLIGGKTSAGTQVVVHTVGNEANTKTILDVGDVHLAQARVSRIKASLDAKIDESVKLVAILKKIKAMPEKKLGNIVLEKTKRVFNTLKHLSKLKARLTEELASAESILAAAKSANITVKKTAYPNLVISINDHTTTSKRRHEKSGSFVIKDEALCFIVPDTEGKES